MRSALLIASCHQFGPVIRVKSYREEKKMAGILCFTNAYQDCSVTMCERERGCGAIDTLPEEKDAPLINPVSTRSSC